MTRITSLDLPYRSLSSMNRLRGVRAALACDVAGWLAWSGVGLEDAELVAFGVTQDGPAKVMASVFGHGRAQAEGAVDLFVSGGAVGDEVHVGAVLDLLGVGNNSSTRSEDRWTAQTGSRRAHVFDAMLRIAREYRMPVYSTEGGHFL